MKGEPKKAVDIAMKEKKRSNEMKQKKKTKRDGPKVKTSLKFERKM